MAEGRRPGLQREGLRFFGAVGAGLSHELSNVFNIINELSGLQQDIAAAAQAGGAGIARLSELAARIKSQVARGEEINRSLHRLSHSVDEAEEVFDLGDALALFGALAARPARLAEVELALRPPADPIALSGDPFALLLALHACFKGVLGAAESGRRVEVRTESVAGRVRVVLASADPVPGLGSDPALASMLDLACAALGAVARSEPDGRGGGSVILELGAGSGPGTGDP
jgi:hypothetical protein